nr:Gag-Pol polyprotein [Tanacetum cinerariifolium]
MTPTEAINAALILFAKAFQLSAPTNNNQRTSSNPRNRQLAQSVCNMGQDRLTQNVRGNGGNQFGQYASQVTQNRQGFNAWQNGRIQGVQNAGMQSGGNQNGLVVVPGIANQSGTGNVGAARAEDDQAIQTILLGLPEDIYAAVDSCETAKEISECVRQMMKGSDIGEQEKKAKLFNEWDKFTSTDGESIESYYHRFMQLMIDLKRNKHFPENIASNKESS